MLAFFLLGMGSPVSYAVYKRSNQGDENAVCLRIQPGCMGFSFEVAALAFYLSFFNQKREGSSFH